jgi:hypothetical protein
MHRRAASRCCFFSATTPCELRAHRRMAVLSRCCSPALFLCSATSSSHRFPFACTLVSLAPSPPSHEGPLIASPLRRRRSRRAKARVSGTRPMPAAASRKTAEGGARYKSTKRRRLMPGDLRAPCSLHAARCRRGGRARSRLCRCRGDGFSGRKTDREARREPLNPRLS